MTLITVLEISFITPYRKTRLGKLVLMARETIASDELHTWHNQKHYSFNYTEILPQKFEGFNSYRVFLNS